MIIGAHERCREHSGEHRDGDRTAEEQAEDRRELDVAHPHPPRVGEREQEQEAAGRGAGDQLLGDLGWVRRQPDRNGRDRRRAA